MEAISKLEELGEVQQDNWGQWIWTKTGKPVGKTRRKRLILELFHCLLLIFYRIYQSFYISDASRKFFRG